MRSESEPKRQRACARIQSWQGRGGLTKGVRTRMSVFEETSSKALRAIDTFRGALTETRKGRRLGDVAMVREQSQG